MNSIIDESSVGNVISLDRLFKSWSA